MKKLDEFLNKPGGAFLMNLLAQQGYSTMPGSPLGAVGRASQATQQQMMQQGQQDMQKRFIESQIGLNNARMNQPPKQPASFSLLTDAQEKELGLDVTGSYQRDDASGKISSVGGNRGPLVSLDMSDKNKGKFGQELASGMASNFVKDYGEAKTALSTLDSISNARQALEAGAITGTGADFRLQLAKALNFAGITEDERVANTEVYISQSAGLVAQVIKAFGSGTGLSDKDREFAEMMAGANPKMDKESIMRVLQMAETAQNNLVSNINDTRSRLSAYDPSLDQLLPPSLSLPEKAEPAQAAPLEDFNPEQMTKEQLEAILKEPS